MAVVDAEIVWLITSFLPQFAPQTFAAVFLVVLTLQVPLVLVLSETNLFQKIVSY